MRTVFRMRLGRCAFFSFTISLMMPTGAAIACNGTGVCSPEAPLAPQSGSSVQIVVQVPEGLEVPDRVNGASPSLFLGSTRQVNDEMLLAAALALTILAVGAVIFIGTRRARRPLSEMLDRTRRLEAKLRS